MKFAFETPGDAQTVKNTLAEQIIGREADHIDPDTRARAEAGKAAALAIVATLTPEVLHADDDATVTIAGDELGVTVSVQANAKAKAARQEREKQAAADQAAFESDRFAKHGA
jgi:hypothetical protein